MVIIGSSVSVFIVGIVVGNAFVVASVAAYREMRTLTNWMIVSLASADLLVAVAVLPLSAYQVPRFRHSRSGGSRGGVQTPAFLFRCPSLKRTYFENMSLRFSAEQGAS